jgi:hypothetical protein
MLFQTIALTKTKVKSKDVLRCWWDILFQNFVEIFVHGNIDRLSAQWAIGVPLDHIGTVQCVCTIRAKHGFICRVPPKTQNWCRSRLVHNILQ